MENNDERITALFRHADFDAQGRVKTRVLARLLNPASAPVPARSVLAKALVGVLVCFVLAAASAQWFHKRDRAGTELSPDCYAYYNFPSRGDTVFLAMDRIPADWRAQYNFPSFRHDVRL